MLWAWEDLEGGACSQNPDFGPNPRRIFSSTHVEAWVLLPASPPRAR